MGTSVRVRLATPLLTSRRHIDFLRTSSAICRPF
ncbi:MULTISPECIES: putative leader peptide [unclassified Streptomyces]